MVVGAAAAKITKAAGHRLHARPGRVIGPGAAPPPAVTQAGHSDPAAAMQAAAQNAARTSEMAALLLDPPAMSHAADAIAAHLPFNSPLPTQCVPVSSRNSAMNLAP